MSKEKKVEAIIEEEETTTNTTQTTEGEELNGLDCNEQLNQELEETKDRLLRLHAEFDNYRKRTQKEKEEWYKYASAGILEKLLPVLDNFERALNALDLQSEEAQSLLAGVTMIYRQLTETLQKEGLEPIVAVGEIFDPNFHEAMLQVPLEAGQQDGQVVEELRKGYRFKEHVLRHTLTKVAKN